jgi:hypothetical protein
MIVGYNTGYIMIYFQIFLKLRNMIFLFIFQSEITSAHVYQISVRPVSTNLEIVCIFCIRLRQLQLRPCGVARVDSGSCESIN